MVPKVAVPVPATSTEPRKRALEEVATRAPLSAEAARVAAHGDQPKALSVVALRTVPAARVRVRVAAGVVSGMVPLRVRVAPAPVTS